MQTGNGNTIVSLHTVYRVSPEDGLLLFRRGDLVPVDEEPVTDFRAPVWVAGARRHDLAVFGCVIDEDGATNLEYLVTSSASSRAQLTPPELIERFSVFQTPELAKKFATLSEEELAQLGVGSLVKIVRERYPNIKGLVR